MGELAEIIVERFVFFEKADPVRFEPVDVKSGGLALFDHAEAAVKPLFKL